MEFQLIAVVIRLTNPPGEQVDGIMDQQLFFFETLVPVDLTFNQVHTQWKVQEDW